MILIDKYYLREIEVTAESAVDVALSQQNQGGHFESLEAQLAALQGIVGRLLARVPEDEWLDICGLQYTYARKVL